MAGRNKSGALVLNFRKRGRLTDRLAQSSENLVIVEIGLEVPATQHTKSLLGEWFDITRSPVVAVDHPDDF